MYVCILLASYCGHYLETEWSVANGTSFVATDGAGPSSANGTFEHAAIAVIAVGICELLSGVPSQQYPERLCRPFGLKMPHDFVGVQVRYGYCR
jgi:hypothetical protein